MRPISLPFDARAPLCDFRPLRARAPPKKAPSKRALNSFTGRTDSTLGVLLRHSEGNEKALRK